jgi:hypothetical protein
MFVSRARQTSSCDTLRNAGVVSSWLITTAAVGAFAFVAGDNTEQELTGQAINPVVTVSAGVTSPDTPRPVLGSVIAHARVAAAVVDANRRTGPQTRCGSEPSVQHVATMLRERAAQSSNRRGPVTVARAADFTCRHAIATSPTATRVGSTPGSGLPGRLSSDAPR